MQDALEDKHYLRSRVELLEEEARASSSRWACLCLRPGGHYA